MLDRHKLVIIGDSGVGKTTIFKRYIMGKTDFENTQTTIVATPAISKSLNEVGNTFEIWDTAGQEKFRSLVPLYYRNSVGCICVFDVTNRKSFDNIGMWIQIFKDYSPCRTSPPLILFLANKTDKPSYEWDVDSLDIHMLARTYDCEVLLVSGLYGKNSGDFDKCLQNLYNKIPCQEEETTVFELNKPSNTIYDTCYSSC
jgi:small GTP-binding protein